MVKMDAAPVWSQTLNFFKGHSCVFLLTVSEKTPRCEGKKEKCSVQLKKKKEKNQTSSGFTDYYSQETHLQSEQSVQKG